MRRACRRDDDVSAVARGIKVVELNRLPVEFLRQPNSAIVSAVRYKDSTRQPCAIRCRAASSLIFPAPTMNTVFPSRLPKIFFASSTATDAIDTDEDPTAVSLRTRLATAKARLKS